jgi:hemoglobin
MSASLFERLGGIEGITRIASDVVDNHLANAAIAARFHVTEVAKFKTIVADFFITGTGGPSRYTGKDMLAAHKGMNISPAEFMTVLDDAMKALEKNGIGQREQEEVLYTLYSMRGEVVSV